jgi:hypothetical protein
MRIGLVFLNVCFLLLINCNDNKQSITDEIDTKNKKIEITAKAIENFNYTDYALSSNGEIEVADWGKYQELAIQIDYLRKADLSFFNGDKEPLKKFIDEFKISCPVNLQTNPITSRVVIIETSLLKLNENLTIDNIDLSLKLMSVKEVLEAFSNLNYQINKKLERDVYSKIEKE